MLGVLPMSRAILRFRSGIATSLQGTVAESNAATRTATSRGPAEGAIAPRRNAKLKNTSEQFLELLHNFLTILSRNAMGPRRNDSGVVASGYFFRSILTVRPVDSSQMICLD